MTASLISRIHRSPRFSFWIHPTEGPWQRKRFERGFTIVLFKRGFWVGTRGIGLFSWAARSRLWPRDSRVTW